MTASFRISMMVLNHQTRESVWDAAVPSYPAGPWRLPPQTTYLFKNANVIDVATGTILANQRVKISDGRVEYVKKTSLSSTLEGVVVVDLEGRYLCPGLIDCHVHLAAIACEGGRPEPGTPLTSFKQTFICQQLLRRGFTTVRDMGGAPLALKQAIENDIIQGPRVLICNKALTPTGGPGDLRGSDGDYLLCCKGGDGSSTVVDGVADCIRVTREQLRDGADLIKIMVGDKAADGHMRAAAQFTSEEVRAIVDVAADYGVNVTAHARSPGAIRHAIDNGVDRIEHGALVDKQMAEYMAEKNTWFTPSLVPYGYATRSEHRSEHQAPLPTVTPTKTVIQAMPNDEQPLQVAHRAGVRLCHGSELPGSLEGTLNPEISMWDKAMDGKAVLRGATVNAAEMLGLGHMLGQVKAGFAADMLVLKGNPLVDKSVLSLPSHNVLAVIKNGRVCVSRWSRLPEDVSPKEMIE